MKRFVMKRTTIAEGEKGCKKNGEMLKGGQINKRNIDKSIGNKIYGQANQLESDGYYQDMDDL